MGKNQLKGTRISFIDDTNACFFSREYNSLQIKGHFSSLKVQSWLEMSFQDIEHAGYKITDHEGSFCFESMILGSHLQCHIGYVLKVLLTLRKSV